MNNAPLFDSITIIGVGLIGSSLGRAIIHKKLATHVIGLEKTETLAEEAMQYHAVTRATTDIKDAVKDSDLVILSVPMLSYKEVLQKTIPLMKKGSILSDVGSVKRHALDTMYRICQERGRDDIELIPAHPIAGTEFSGAKNGKAHLFQNMFCLLTPADSASPKAVGKLTELWKIIGAKVEKLDIAHHDDVLAITSHLPHLIAYSIVHTVNEFENKNNGGEGREVVKYSASGWRDFTRIAASNPVMWRDIFLDNQQPLLAQLDRFIGDLQKLQTAIQEKDGAFLHDWFAKTRSIRQSLMTHLPTEEEQKKIFYHD